VQAGNLGEGPTHQPTNASRAQWLETATSGHICFYAGDIDCRPRHFERLMKWQQPMPGARVHHLSGFVVVGGPEGRRADKVAWSRRCAMLMGSACSLWTLEHVCANVLELSRYLENITEPLGRQSDRPWAYHFPGSKWKKESLALPRLLHRALSQSAVSSNERLAWLIRSISHSCVCPHLFLSCINMAR
jgi:hypothetical protein